MLVSFEVVPGAERNYLTWVTPEDTDVDASVIRFSADGYPNEVTSGSPVANGNDGWFDCGAGSTLSFTHEGLLEGLPYYYSAFVHLTDPERFSAPTQRCATPGDSLYETPPVLKVALFQNPYLTTYVDLYLLSSKSLDSTSIEMSTGSESIEMQRQDEDGCIWRGDWKLTGVSDSISLTACASDKAGHHVCTGASLTAGLVSTSRSTVLKSHDGRVQIEFEPDAAREEFHVLLFQGIAGMDGRDLRLRGKADDFTPAFASEENQSGDLVYTISPLTGLEGSLAQLTFRYKGLAEFEGLSPDRLCIERVGSGPLESYVDPQGETVTARIDRLGTFRLVTGESGVGRKVDIDFLSIEPCKPNPFSAATVIPLTVRAAQHLDVSVYDVQGRLLRRIVDQNVHPGRFEVTWDGYDNAGRQVPEGVYFVKASTSRAQQARKVLIVR
jgi:hypothetical protein